MADEYPPPKDDPGYPPPPEYPLPPEYPAALYPAPPAFAYPYGAPYAAPMPMPSRETNGFAIASLVCAILGLCAGFLAALPAIVFGHVALAQINRSGGMQQGRGMAIAGLAIGYVFLALPVLYIVFLIAVAASTSTQP